MRVKIKMKNTLENQQIGRKIRYANREISNSVEINFEKDLSEFHIEGKFIWIPKKTWFSNKMLIEGQVKEKGDGIEIKPKERGKTINLHLDADLVSELNEIRKHVLGKTQHDLVLELFKKGMDQYNKEKNNSIH